MRASAGSCSAPKTAGPFGPSRGLWIQWYAHTPFLQLSPPSLFHLPHPGLGLRTLKGGAKGLFGGKRDKMVKGFPGSNLQLNCSFLGIENPFRPLPRAAGHRP